MICAPRHVRCAFVALIVLLGVHHRAPAAPPTTSRPLDLSTPAAALQSVKTAILSGDPRAIAQTIRLPASLQPDEIPLYCERLTLSAKITLELQKRVSHDWIVRILRIVELPTLPVIDLDKAEWHDALAGTNGFGKPLPPQGFCSIPGGWFFPLRRFPAGWMLDTYAGGSTGLAMTLEDAPWRNAMMRRVLADLRADKLHTGDDVINALTLHAKPVQPTTSTTDRSTPDGVLAAYDAAIRRGDAATAADCMIFLHEKDGGARRRKDAESRVMEYKLARALRDKFGMEQGERLIHSGRLLSTEHALRFTNVAWAIDGDVARGVYDPPAYRTYPRMVRSNGIWRLQLPPVDEHLTPEQTVAMLKEQHDMDAIVAREQHLLAHLDEYPTPGAVNSYLNKDPAANTADIAKDAKEATEQLNDFRRRLATQPTQSAKDRARADVSTMIVKSNIAFVTGHFDEAASYYYAAGDVDGAYCKARERRAAATTQLMSALENEVGGNGEMLAGDFTLINAADTAADIAEFDWDFHDDFITLKRPADYEHPIWLPQFRRVNGQWKIDVTDEVAGDPKSAAARADADTKAIDAIIAQLKSGKFTSELQVRNALKAADVKGTGKRE
jgi:hypothetical protein